VQRNALAVRYEKKERTDNNSYFDAPVWDEVTLIEQDYTLANTRTGERGRSGGVFGELHPL